MKLFMYIALADALYYSNQFFVYNTCYFRLPELISVTLFFQDSSVYYQYRALYILVISQQFQQITGLCLAVTLNLCLVFDLVYMILYPFSQKEKFMTFYAGLCFAFSSVTSAFMTYGLMTNTSKYNLGFWALLFLYTLMFFGGFGSIIFAYMRLSKPGISASARTLILKRHAMSIVVFILTNLNITVTIFYSDFHLKFPNPQVSESLTWTIVLKALFFLEGVISPLIRLNEPVFRVLLV